MTRASKSWSSRSGAGSNPAFTPRSPCGRQVEAIRHRVRRVSLRLLELPHRGVCNLSHCEGHQRTQANATEQPCSDSGRAAGGDSPDGDPGYAQDKAVGEA